MNKKHIKYWEKRTSKLEQARMKKAEEYVKKLEKEYIKTFNAIQKDIESFYIRYMDENNVSYTEATKLLNNKELKMWKVSVEEYIDMAKQYKYTDIYNDELKKLYIKTRIDRLQALQTDIKARVYDLYYNYNIEATDLFTDCIKDVYYRNIYEVDKFLGIGSDFALLNDKVIKDVLTYPWSGKDFSSRIHINRDKTVQVLEETLTNGLIRGLSIDNMTKELENKLVISKRNAEVLIRTETNFFLNESSERAYEECKLEKYQVLATLDSRTTPICREQDLKVYNVKDRKVGVNQPPFHIRCRTTTIPYFEDIEGTRIARGENGKTYDVPADMSYKKWYNEHVDNGKAETIKKQVHKEIKQGTYPLKYKKEKYEEHLEGHKRYNSYCKRLKEKGYNYKPSTINITFDKAQELVKKYAGTGELVMTKDGNRWNKQEVISSHKKPIGIYRDKEGNEFKTSNFKIHYSKKGTHIVPYK